MKLYINNSISYQNKLKFNEHILYDLANQDITKWNIVHEEYDDSRIMKVYHNKIYNVNVYKSEISYIIDENSCKDIKTMYDISKYKSDKIGKTKFMK